MTDDRKARESAATTPSTSNEASFVTTSLFVPLPGDPQSPTPDSQGSPRELSSEEVTARAASHGKTQAELELQESFITHPSSGPRRQLAEAVIQVRAITDAVAVVEEHLAGGDLGQAQEALAQAQVRFGDRTVFVNLRSRLEGLLEDSPGEDSRQSPNGEDSNGEDSNREDTAWWDVPLRSDPQAPQD